MTGQWITDIRHFLDEQGRVPNDLPPVPHYMGAIVAAASPLPADRVFPLIFIAVVGRDTRAAPAASTPE